MSVIWWSPVFDQPGYGRPGDLGRHRGVRHGARPL